MSTQEQSAIRSIDEDCKKLQRTGYSSADFVPTTNADEVIIYESLASGNPYTHHFKSAVQEQSHVSVVSVWGVESGTLSNCVSLI